MYSQMQAHEEAERARFFVPKNLLEMAPTRPRPLLVCISRDVSGCAKKEINAYLCKELPGKRERERGNIERGNI